MQKFLLILISTILVNATYCSQSSSQQRDPVTECALLGRYCEASPTKKEEDGLKMLMIIAWLSRTSREQDTTIDPNPHIRVNHVILP